MLNLTPTLLWKTKRFPSPRHGGLRHALQKAYHVRVPPHRASIGRESKGLTAPRCQLSILTPPRPAGRIRPPEGFRDGPTPSGPELVLPEDAVTQTFAIRAKRGVLWLSWLLARREPSSFTSSRFSV